MTTRNWIIIILMILVGNVVVQTGINKQTELGIIFVLVFLGAVSSVNRFYLNESGIINIPLIGLLLGDIFIWNRYNLLIPILTHNAINIVKSLLGFFNHFNSLHNLLLKETA